MVLGLPYTSSDATIPSLPGNKINQFSGRKSDYVH